MTKTTFQQKVFLLFFGILLLCLFLEFGLRAGGAFYTFMQERQNQKDASDSVVRVLCIGESTTAIGGENAYPFQMEQMLNERKKGLKFKVINKGMVSKTSKDILEQLDENLLKYKPHLVVAMIGINDPYYVFKENEKAVLKRELFLQNVRVYKLFKLLGKHLKHKLAFLGKKEEFKDDLIKQQKLKEYTAEEWMEEDIVDIDELKGVLDGISKAEEYTAKLQTYLTESKHSKDEVKKVVTEMVKLKAQKFWLYIRTGVYHKRRKNYLEAEKYLKLAVSTDSDNVAGYVELARTYKEQKKFKMAIVIFKKAIELYPETILGHMETARCYDSLGLKKEAFKSYYFVFKLGSESYWYYPEIGRWLKEHNYLRQAEEVFLKAIEVNAKDYLLYEQLAQVYESLHIKEKEEKYRVLANERKSSAVSYSLFTEHNYKRIVNMILSKGIKLICMQYPVRSVEPLKEMLNDRSQIVFVENKNNFAEVLKKAEYSRYFSDNFAGDFGHCTRAGNRLIAENVSNVIFEKVFKN